MATAEAAVTGVSFAKSHEGQGQADTTNRTRRRSSNGDSQGPKTRRSSSLVTDTTFDDAAMRSSSVGDSIENEVEVSLWYSVPLLLAIVPAIAGIAFQKGSVIITDLALLVLAGVYLQWCLVTPW